MGINITLIWRSSYSLGFSKVHAGMNKRCYSIPSVCNYGAYNDMAKGVSIGEVRMRAANRARCTIFDVGFDRPFAGG